MPNERQDQASPQQQRHFGVEEAVFILLVLLSLTGIVITDYSPSDGYGYWLLMVPIFAMLSIFVSWLQAKKIEELDFGNIVKQQSLHWFHTLVIVGAAALLNKSGQLSEIGASLVILLILSLATMLDGFRIGWQFSLLGFFLAACAIAVAYAQAFILVCSGLAALVILGSLLWGFWHREINTNHER